MTSVLLGILSDFFYFFFINISLGVMEERLQSHDLRKNLHHNASLNNVPYREIALPRNWTLFNLLKSMLPSNSQSIIIISLFIVFEGDSINIIEHFQNPLLNPPCFIILFCLLYSFSKLTILLGFLFCEQEH